MMKYFINIINNLKAQPALLLITFLLYIHFLVLGCGIFFNKLSFHEAINVTIFFVAVLLCCFLFGDFLDTRARNKQAQEFNIFLIKHPTIDIKNILKILDKFSLLVRNQNIDKIKDLITNKNQNLIQNIQHDILNKYHYRICLRSYTISRESLFPLRRSITVLDENTIKIKVNRHKLFPSEDDNSPGEFYHYFIFKNYENCWIIVDTNFCKKLKWKKITTFILIILFVIGFLLYCGSHMTAILEFFGF